MNEQAGEISTQRAEHIEKTIADLSHEEAELEERLLMVEIERVQGIERLGIVKAAKAGLLQAHPDPLPLNGDGGWVQPGFIVENNTNGAKDMVLQQLRAVETQPEDWDGYRRLGFTIDEDPPVSPSELRQIMAASPMPEGAKPKKVQEIRRQWVQAALLLMARKTPGGGNRLINFINPMYAVGMSKVEPRGFRETVKSQLKQLPAIWHEEGQGVWKLLEISSDQQDAREVGCSPSEDISHHANGVAAS